MQILTQLPFILTALLHAFASSKPLALSDAGSNLTSQVAPGCPNECTRRWYNIQMDVLDEEWFSEDEKTDVDFNWQFTGVDADWPSSNPIYEEIRLGGEIRVELRYHWEYRPCQLFFVYDLKLFEGASEDTNDLDGRKSGRVEMLPNFPITVSVNNTDEGGDWVRMDVKYHLEENCPR
ncbi:MAG: hypothetical protein Q9217_004105 [Psora testacea]